MSVDWDGKIRMNPSSAYAMQGLIGLKDRFDIAFACDTDHDRHGIVTPNTPSRLTPEQVESKELAGEAIHSRPGTGQWRSNRRT